MNNNIQRGKLVLVILFAAALTASANPSGKTSNAPSGTRNFHK
jgi:hypothetical protein